jgi:hypothetical protein
MTLPEIPIGDTGIEQVFEKNLKETFCTLFIGTTFLQMFLHPCITF